MVAPEVASRAATLCGFTQRAPTGEPTLFRLGIVRREAYEGPRLCGAPLLIWVTGLLIENASACAGTSLTALRQVHDSHLMADRRNLQWTSRRFEDESVRGATPFSAEFDLPSAWRCGLGRELSGFGFMRFYGNGLGHSGKSGWILWFESANPGGGGNRQAKLRSANI